MSKFDKILKPSGIAQKIPRGKPSGIALHRPGRIPPGKPDEQWKKELSPEAYRILREKATEMPFTGEYYHCKDKGMYLCRGCGNELFSSETKYESGSGWPSFYAPVSEEGVNKVSDESHGMFRTEVVCSRCGGHLGHVFDDRPEPTGKRYCINSGALSLKKGD